MVNGSLCMFPSRLWEDFLTEEIVERVPERYRLFACALHHAPDYWNDEDRIRKDMRLEASSNDHIDTVCNFIRAQSFLVDQYLTGELDPERCAGCGHGPTIQWSGLRHLRTASPWIPVKGVSNASSIFMSKVQWRLTWLMTTRGCKTS